jgi:hypothetical protein
MTTPDGFLMGAVFGALIAIVGWFIYLKLR